MNEHDNPHPQHPLEPTPWEKFLAITKEEARWLAHTLGVVTVTLAIGRIISRSAPRWCGSRRWQRTTPSV